MTAEQLHIQARALRRVAWAASDVELAVKVTAWSERELAAGADPQLVAEVARLVATNVDRLPRPGESVTAARSREFNETATNNDTTS